MLNGLTSAQLWGPRRTRYAPQSITDTVILMVGKRVRSATGGRCSRLSFVCYKDGRKETHGALHTCTHNLQTARTRNTRTPSHSKRDSKYSPNSKHSLHDYACRIHSKYISKFQFSGVGVAGPVRRHKRQAPFPPYTEPHMLCAILLAGFAVR